jgi:hypothetical protein
LQSKISEGSVFSKLSFAAEGGGIFFTQPQEIFLGGASRQGQRTYETAFFLLW